MPQTLVRPPKATYISNMQKYSGMLQSAAQVYADAVKQRPVRRITVRGGGKPEKSASEKNAIRKAARSARATERQKANAARNVRYKKEQLASDKEARLTEESQRTLAMEEKQVEAEVGLSNVERMQKGMAHATTYLSKVRQDTYDDWVNWIDEEQWAPPDIFMSPEEVNQMAPEEFEAYKSSLVSNMKGERTATKGKQFAPDIKERRNAETGEMIRIDERNPVEVRLAEQSGFAPVGPRSDAFLKGEGKAAATAYDVVTTDAKKARQSIATLQSMKGLLDRFESGKLTNITKNIQQWSTALGIPIDTAELSSKEAFLAFANQLALQSRNLGEGMVLAGQMSDQDVKFLKDMNPQLIISKGGNELIIKIRIALAKRRSEAAKKAYEYKKNNKGYFDPLEFENETRAAYMGTNIFGIPEGAVKVGVDKKTGLPVYDHNGTFMTPDL